MFQLLKNPKIDFLRIRYVGYVLSLGLVGLGVWGLVQLVSGKGRVGIDFVGGTLVSVKFQPAVGIEKIRESLRGANLSDRDVQRISSEEKFLIRLGRGEMAVGTAKESLTQIFSTAFPGNTFVIDRHEEVGPAVGARLRDQAVKAFLISMMAILLYIWLRFDLTFGIGATITTLHDVLAVLGVYMLTNKEFSLLIVTAILTIAGYSLTDTVVVYDRIRENLKFLKKEEGFSACINRSLNEVLARTIVTSLTVLVATAALFFWGGEVIHDFAFALLTGLIIGSYSTIFVATPLVVEWEQRFGGSRAP